MRTADVVQEYNYHLGAVNSVTFVDENRRFVTTSDDKTIRVWEFGIPVQVKYIADPSMHAISSTAVSHSGEHGGVWAAAAAAGWWGRRRGEARARRACSRADSRCP